MTSDDKNYSSVFWSKFFSIVNETSKTEPDCIPSGFLRVYGITTTFVCLTGIVLNCYFLSLLGTPAFRTWVNILLSVVAMCNLLLMAIYSVYILHFHILHPMYCDRGRQTYRWAVYGLSVAYLSVFLHGTSMSVVAYIGIQRARRLKLRVYVKQREQRRVHVAPLVGIVLAVFVSCVPSFMATEVIEVHPVSCLKMYPQPTFKVGTSFLATKYPILKTISLWSAGILLKALPCALVTTGIVVMLVELNRFERHRVRRFQRQLAKRNGITVSLSLVLSLFIITQAPQCVVHVILALYDTTECNQFLRSLHLLCDLLSLLNNCINFPLYCLSEKAARAHLLAKCLPQCFDEAEPVEKEESRKYSWVQKMTAMAGLVESQMYYELKNLPMNKSVETIEPRRGKLSRMATLVESRLYELRDNPFSKSDEVAEHSRALRPSRRGRLARTRTMKTFS